MARTLLKSGPTESTMGYFRRVFQDRPALLKTKKNQEIIDQWMHDHPGYTDLELKKARQSLANLKSTLKRRKRGRRKMSRAEAPTDTAEVNNVVHHGPRSRRTLEDLETNIDECLMMAKGLDRVGLETVIRYLRLARNEVVLKNG